jgi:hypothetical protein
MPDIVVNVAALRAAAKALVEEGGPITFLQNAQAKLADAPIGTMALTVLGIGTAQAHDEAAHVHADNLKGGITHLQEAADKLRTSADNWAKSDQPWVVK